jgi:hypothetical protein
MFAVGQVSHHKAKHVLVLLMCIIVLRWLRWSITCSSDTSIVSFASISNLEEASMHIKFKNWMIFEFKSWMIFKFEN